MKIQIIHRRSPSRGTYVDSQLSEVALAQDEQSATFPILFTGWVSAKRHVFNLPTNVIEASILTPELVAKVAKAGAFTRGTRGVPGGGVLGLAARLVAGSLSAALNSDNGTAGLEITYVNEKEMSGSFYLVGDADLIKVLLNTIPPAPRHKDSLNPSDFQASRSLNHSNINGTNEVGDEFYTVVADEISIGSVEKGAWTQAFSEADGNDAKAKAFYIKIRVQQLQREAERNAQNRSFERESEINRIRFLLNSFTQIPYEDTDHISRDDFRGSRSSLLEPVSVSTASSVAGLLAFQVIDFIKRGFLTGVYDEDEWYFELNRQYSI